jgi:ribonuclease BN (tRNA processing enzyme)
VSGGDLDGVLLLDCGPGTVRSLADRGLELLAIKCVVISHFHTDHVLDLFSLAFARRNPSLNPEDVPDLLLIGPVGLRKVLESMPSSMRVLDGERTRCVEVAVDGAGRGAECIPGGRLSCVAAVHTPEALCWRLDSGGKSLVYSGDTGVNADLESLAEGCDLLIAECAFDGSQEPELHLNGEAAGELAEAARASKLVLSHFYPHVNPVEAAASAASVYSGTIQIARDGMRIDI